jgi:hypothetical protein
MTVPGTAGSLDTFTDDPAEELTNEQSFNSILKMLYSFIIQETNGKDICMTALCFGIILLNIIMIHKYISIRFKKEKVSYNSLS